MQGTVGGWFKSKPHEEERPETGVLFISAMAHDILESLPMLQKPFMPRQFLAKVAEVLSTPKNCASPLSP